MSESVRAVERALDILLCFSQDGPALSLTQIAEQVGMHKSTVHRLLATLENRRFVHRDKATGLYRLGFRFIEMASLVLQDVGLRDGPSLPPAPKRRVRRDDRPRSTGRLARHLP